MLQSYINIDLVLLYTFVYNIYEYFKFIPMDILFFEISNSLIGNSS